MDLQNKELEQYKASSDATEAEKAVAQSTQASYEALIVAIEHYNKEGYSTSKLADELLAINTASLGATGVTTYDTMTKKIFAEECERLYPIGTKSYEAVNYNRALECFEKIELMNEQYKEGEVLYMLMDIYQKQGETEKATAKYNRILELYADKDIAKRATELMKPETAQGAE